MSSCKFYCHKWGPKETLLTLQGTRGSLMMSHLQKAIQGSSPGWQNGSTEQQQMGKEGRQDPRRRKRKHDVKREEGVLLQVKERESDEQ